MMDILKFFDKKKRELSNQSNKGEESKRQRESNLGESIANETSSDLFTESLKSEECGAILHNCIKKLKRK